LISVYVPYTGAGKQAIAAEEDIVAEIRFAVMEAARGVQRFLSGRRREHEMENKRKVVTRYVEQLAGDVCDLAGTVKDKKKVKDALNKIIEEKYLATNGEDEEKEEKEAEAKKKEKTDKEEPDEE
jgi:DNA topoisomerase-6 subunit B